jgi:hypothetical protein
MRNPSLFVGRVDQRTSFAVRFRIEHSLCFTPTGHGPCSCIQCTISSLNGCRRDLAASTSRARLHALTLSNLDSGFVVNSSCAHALLDLSSHGQEGLFDVGGVLGGCLEERDSEAVGEFLSKRE